jgi:hypothetical protein
VKIRYGPAAVIPPPSYFSKAEPFQHNDATGPINRDGKAAERGEESEDLPSLLFVGEMENPQAIPAWGFFLKNIMRKEKER